MSITFSYVQSESTKMGKTFFFKYLTRHDKLKKIDSISMYLK